MGEEGTTLRVVTYNVHRCRGLDGRTRPERIAAVLANVDADIIALQEVVGASPLLFIIIAAAVGLWPDPNPNPVGPGLLFFFTFWPAVICIVIGVIRVRLGNRAG